MLKDKKNTIIPILSTIKARLIHSSEFSAISASGSDRLIDDVFPSSSSLYFLFLSRMLNILANDLSFKEKNEDLYNLSL